MKTFAACLVAEFRRARPLLPWLILAHGLTLGVRTRWAGEFSDQLVGMIEWSSWALAALVVVRSLWSDAPLRRERFLATRPQVLWPIFAAKWLGLAVVAALPFGLVDGLALWVGGVGGGFLWLGALQTTLLFLAALTALVPAVWWWRGAGEALTGLAACLAVLVATGWWLGRLPGNRDVYSGETIGLPLGPLLAFVFLASLAVVAGLVLFLIRGRGGLLRVPVFAVLAAVCLWFGLRAAVAPPPADETEEAALVELAIMNERSGSGGQVRFHARVPERPSAPGVHVARSYRRLRIGGCDVRPWRSFDPVPTPGDYEIQSAIARQFGRSSAAAHAEPGHDSPNRAWMPGGVDLDGAQQIGLELLETQLRWDVVADLPVVEGAEACGLESCWKMAGRRIHTRGGGEVLVIESRHCRIWLGPAALRHAPEIERDVVCLLDPERGVIDTFGVSAGRRGTSSLVTAEHMFELSRPRSSPPPGIKNTEDLRVIVLRPRVLRRVAHAWQSPGPIRLVSGRRGYPLSATEIVEDDLLAWLPRHPVPAADAPEDEIDRWFADFLPRVRWHQKQFHNTNDPEWMRQELSELVRRHPRQVLDAAREDEQVPWLIERAIAVALPRDVPARFPEHAADPLVMQTFVRNGWAADLAETAGELARAGRPWQPARVLLAVPHEIGLTEDEWLAFFRLNPAPEVYQALARGVIPREQLDHEADLILEGFRVRPRCVFQSPLLDLALARGRPEAPRWLREDLEGRVELGDSSPTGLRLLDEFFVTPEWGRPTSATSLRELDATKLAWFFSIDPERFVFDRGTGRYKSKP